MIRTNYRKGDFFFMFTICEMVYSDSIAGVWGAAFNNTYSVPFAKYNHGLSLVIAEVIGRTTVYGARTSLSMGTYAPIFYLSLYDSGTSFESMAASDSFHILVLGLISSRH